MTFDFPQRSAQLAAIAAALFLTPFATAYAADAAPVAHAQKTSVGSADTAPADAKQKHWGVIEQYCFKCHNADDWADERRTR